MENSDWFVAFVYTEHSWYHFIKSFPWIRLMRASPILSYRRHFQGWSLQLAIIYSQNNGQILWNRNLGTTQRQMQLVSGHRCTSKQSQWVNFASLSHCEIRSRIVRMVNDIIHMFAKVYAISETLMLSIHVIKLGIKTKIDDSVDANTLNPFTFSFRRGVWSKYPISRNYPSLYSQVDHQSNSTLFLLLTLIAIL